MKSLIFTAGLIVFGGIPFFSYAAPIYTVAPLVIDVKAEARDILTHEITLTNTGTQNVTLYPTVNNISIDEGGVTEAFLPPAASDRTSSLSSWIEIKRSGVKLRAGETIVLPLTLRINPTPVPGEYHARIGFGYGRNQFEAEKQVKLGRAPSTIVTVTIEDDKNEFLRLSRFIIDRFVTSSDNQAAVYTVTNPGDETLVPSGEIIFYDKRGVEVSSMQVNPDHASIPAGGEKQFNVEVPIQGMFGKYKAFLSVEYGSAQLASVQDTTFFYVFPLKMIIILFGIIAVLVVLIALYVHKKYLDDSEIDDSDFVPVHIKPTVSESQEHDIDLKKQ